MTPRASEFMNDPTVIHAMTAHADRVRSMAYHTVIQRTYDRGGMNTDDEDNPVECGECRQIAQARLAYFTGALIDGTGPFVVKP